MSLNFVEAAYKTEGTYTSFGVTLVEGNIAPTNYALIDGNVIHLEPGERVTAFTTREGGIIHRYKKQKKLNAVHSFSTSSGRIWDRSLGTWRAPVCTWKGSILEDGLPCE